MKLIFSTLVFVLLFETEVSPVQAQSHSPGLRGQLKEKKQELKKDIQEKREEIREEFREIKASVSAALRQLKSGRIAFGSAEITAINGTTLTVIHESKTYTVLTDDKTQFRRKFWGKSELAEFNVGDKINGVGTWEDEGHTNIRARLIRNMSIQMRYGVFFGTVKEVTGTGFTMETERRGVQTVTVGQDTSYVNRR